MLIVGLIVASLVLTFLEVLLPGGLLGILAAVCLVAATAITMQDYGFFIAAILFFATTIIALGMIIVELKIFAGTKYGKHFFLSSQIQGRSNKCQAKASIIGEIGSTLTPMVPGGRVTINGKIFDASSSDGYMEANTPVKVISQDSFKLTIQKL